MRGVSKNAFNPDFFDTSEQKNQYRAPKRECGFDNGAEAGFFVVKFLCSGQADTVMGQPNGNDQAD